MEGNGVLADSGHKVITGLKETPSQASACVICIGHQVERNRDRKRYDKVEELVQQRLLPTIGAHDSLVNSGYNRNRDNV